MTQSIDYCIHQLSEYYGREALGRFPTPVEPMALGKASGNRRFWIKRDDLSSFIYGGNKTRKLEFLLKKSSRPVLTFGPKGSHHVLSTALHARHIGRETGAILVPQHMTPHHELVYQEILKVCDPVIELAAIPASLGKLFRVFFGRLLTSKSMFQLCPPGGTSPRGTLGYVIGGLELASQIQTGLLPEPARIFVPLGTGGTSVGIAIGLAMAGLDCETVAVRVVPQLALPRVSLTLLTARTLRLIGNAGLASPGQSQIRYTILNGFSNGYAVPDERAEEALDTAKSVGIALETTYSAKAMAAMLHHGKTGMDDERPYLFWQTFANL